MALDKQKLKTYASQRLEGIPEEEFLKYSEEEREDFEKELISPANVYYYYKRVSPTDDELDTALLYKLCKSQDETNKHLKAIKGILIFFTVLTIIGIIAGVVLLNQ